MKKYAIKVTRNIYISPALGDELRNQIEYYMSVVNMAGDFYLRSEMERTYRKWIQIDTFMRCKKVQMIIKKKMGTITPQIQRKMIHAALQDSQVLKAVKYKVKHKSIRLRRQFKKVLYFEDINLQKLLAIIYELGIQSHSFDVKEVSECIFIYFKGLDEERVLELHKILKETMMQEYLVYTMKQFLEFEKMLQKQMQKGDQVEEEDPNRFLQNQVILQRGKALCANSISIEGYKCSFKGRRVEKSLEQIQKQAHEYELQEGSEGSSNFDPDIIMFEEDPEYKYHPKVYPKHTATYNIKRARVPPDDELKSSYQRLQHTDPQVYRKLQLYFNYPYTDNQRDLYDLARAKKKIVKSNPKKGKIDLVSRQQEESAWRQSQHFVYDQWQSGEESLLDNFEYKSPVKKNRDIGVIQEEEEENDSSKKRFIMKELDNYFEVFECVNGMIRRRY